MSAKNGIEVDVMGWRKQVNRFANRWGLSARDLMRYEMGLWASDLVRKSWPRTYAQGRWRVENDILKIFEPINDSREVKVSDQVFLRHKTKEGVVYGVDMDLFRPNADTAMMAAHHDKYRRKDGRVTEARGGGETFFGSRGGDKQIGRWKFVDKMHVEPGALRRFIRYRQGHVGRLKAGWLAMVRRFGGKAPKWVMRHSGDGTAADRMQADGNGFLIGINAVPYAARKLKGLLEASARTRERHLSHHLHKNMEEVVAYFNRMRNAA